MQLNSDNACPALAVRAEILNRLLCYVMLKAPRKRSLQRELEQDMHKVLRANDLCRCFR